MALERVVEVDINCLQMVKYFSFEFDTERVLAEEQINSPMQFSSCGASSQAVR